MHFPSLLQTWGRKRRHLPDRDSPRVSPCPRRAPHPVVEADLAVPAAGAGAEVKGAGWKAFAVETQHSGPAGRPVLHVAQVRPIHQLHVAAPVPGQSQQVTPGPLGAGAVPVASVAPSPAIHVAVLVVEGGGGDLPAELPEPRRPRDVGAEEEAAEDVPAMRRWCHQDGGWHREGPRGQRSLTACCTAASPGPRARSSPAPSPPRSASRSRSARPSLAESDCHLLVTPCVPPAQDNTHCGPTARCTDGPGSCSARRNIVPAGRGGVRGQEKGQGTGEGSGVLERGQGTGRGSGVRRRVRGPGEG